jgi:hypothetical protein
MQRYITIWLEPEKLNWAFCVSESHDEMARVVTNLLKQPKLPIRYVTYELGGKLDDYSIKF